MTTTTAMIIAIFDEFFGLSAGGGVEPGAGAAAGSPPGTGTGDGAPPSGDGGGVTGDGSGAGGVAGVGATGSGGGVGAAPGAGAPGFGEVGGVGWFGSIKSCFLWLKYNFNAYAAILAEVSLSGKGVANFGQPYQLLIN
ncbi:MAG TPA: hypothetical protein VLG47_07500 [Candidatus Saccharimonadales bacterium]|nr:hypothetical protein [Candidatus Saccharimonadales bacterium]